MRILKFLFQTAMRLNRYLSACGLGSRRGSENLIREGQVTINGKVCLELATVVTDEDEVVVHGKKVKPNKGVFIALNKPRGFVCTRRDEHDRDTLYTLLPEKYATLHHVGRLDKDSDGLILLTNQGEISQQLTHPSKGVEKEYEVMIEERFDPAHLERLIKGFHTEEGMAKAERAWMIGDYKIGLVLKQGLKRQIRNMLYFLGYEVKRLTRVRIGNLSIKGIREGQWKELTPEEVDKFLLNPLAKDRPKLSKPKTASIKRQVEKREVAAKKRATRLGKSREESSARGSSKRDGFKPSPKSSSKFSSKRTNKKPRGSDRGGR